MRKILLFVLAAYFIFAQSLYASSGSSLSILEKLFLEGKYSVVIAEADALIKSGSGKNDELYYLKGLSELKTNKLAAARTSFNRIISDHSRSKKAFDARIGIGDSYMLEGDNAKALSAYNDVIERYPSNDNIAIVYARLSSCYAGMGVNDKAYSCYEMVRKKAPLSFEAKIAPAVKAASKDTVAVSIPRPKADIGIYSVQVGSFKSKRNADRLSRKLSSRGYRSYVAIPVLSSDKFYRVRVGNLASKAEASKVASALESDGYRIKVCADDVCE